MKKRFDSYDTGVFGYVMTGVSVIVYVLIACAVAYSARCTVAAGIPQEHMIKIYKFQESQRLRNDTIRIAR